MLHVGKVKDKYTEDLLPDSWTIHGLHEGKTGFPLRLELHKGRPGHSGTPAYHQETDPQRRQRNYPYLEVNKEVTNIYKLK